MAHFAHPPQSSNLMALAHLDVSPLPAGAPETSDHGPGRFAFRTTVTDPLGRVWNWAPGFDAYRHDIPGDRGTILKTAGELAHDLEPGALIPPPAPPRIQALTVQQPWASCIAAGGKTIENRPWITKHRGMLAIHAGKVTDPKGIDDGRVRALLGVGAHRVLPELPHGVIVAVVRLVGIHHTVRVMPLCCRPWGEHQQYHWELQGAQRLTRTVPCRGWPGLFDLPDDVAAAVTPQVVTR